MSKFMIIVFGFVCMYVVMVSTLPVCVSIYVNVCACVCVCEREREREGEHVVYKCYCHRNNF